MKKAYLDNASTTAMRPEVIDVMTQVMAEHYGNPSSTHSFGRSAKVVVESARKAIAGLLGAEAREIVFTSCGTEANNWIIRSAVKDLGVRRIISSRVEHHSVLHSLDAVAAEYGTRIDYVKLTSAGNVDFDDLEALLQEEIPTILSLIHVNNETGVILELEKAGNLCRQYKAWFHTDTVQSIGKNTFNLQQLPIDFLVASAHKFHGPKGMGFAFVRKNLVLKPLLHGGEQEKGLRAGTEAVHQIAGMAKALEVSYQMLEQEQKHVLMLKQYLKEQLEVHFAGYRINSTNGNDDSGLFFNIMNVLLPIAEEKTSMILFHLDMKGVAVSRGSACQSGSIKPSHVLKEILPEADVKKPSLRISLSHYNTKEDIELLIEALKTV